MDTMELSRDVERVLKARHAAAVIDRLGEDVRWGLMMCKLIEAGAPVGLRTNVGLDIVSAAWLNGSQGGGGVTTGGFFSGTASATGATSITLDFNAPVNSLVGQIVVTTSGANRFGIIQSNTSVASSVATIDRWYDATALPADPGVAAASTPTAGAYVLVGGNAPCLYMALADSGSAAAPAVTDTTLAGEITTATGGLIRKLGTYAHSASSSGSATVTVSKTWTMNAADVAAVTPRTVSQVGVFQGVVVASSRLAIKTALNANATLTASGDQVQVTETITAT